MGLKAKDNTTSRISILELIIGGIASWIIHKLLDSAWARAKKTPSAIKFGYPTLIRMFLLFMTEVYGIDKQKVGSLLKQYNRMNARNAVMIIHDCFPLMLEVAIPPAKNLRIFRQSDGL